MTFYGYNLRNLEPAQQPVLKAKFFALPTKNPRFLCQWTWNTMTAVLNLLKSVLISRYNNTFPSSSSNPVDNDPKTKIPPFKSLCKRHR